MLKEVEATDPDFDQLESLMAGQQLPAGTETPAQAQAPPTEEVPAAAAAEEVPAEPAPGTEEAPAETAPAEEAPAEEGAKKKGWIDQRLAALAAKRREAESRASQAIHESEELRATNERLQRELEAQRGQPGPGQNPPANVPPNNAAGDKFDKPKPILKAYTQEGGEHYKEDDGYDDAAQRHAEALAEWVDERRTFQAQRETAAVEERKQTAIFQSDIGLALEEHPDWEDARDLVLSHSSPQFQVALSHLPRFSDKQPAWTEVVAYLGEHPDDLARLNTLHQQNPYAAVAELGQIAHSLNPAPKAAIPAKAIPVKTSIPAAQAQPAAPPKQAARPPAKVGGATAPGPVDLDTADMDTFAREMPKYGIGPSARH